MRKYLELIDNVSEISKIKSYRVPYVGSAEDGKMQFSTILPSNTLLLSHVGVLEYTIDGPSTLLFAVPLYSHGNILFIPDQEDGQSPSTFLSWSIIDYGGGKHAWETTLEAAASYLDGSTDLKVFDIEFYCSGLLRIEIFDNVYDLIDNSLIINHKNKAYEINSANRLLLFKKGLLAQNSSFFTWNGESAATLYLFKDMYLNEPISAAESLIELNSNTPVQLYDTIRQFSTFAKNAKLVSDSPGTLTVTRFAYPPQNDALLLDYNTEFVATKDTVFAFPSVLFTEKPLMFVPNVTDGVTMEISDSPLFDSESGTVLTLSISTFKEDAIHLTKSNLSTIAKIAKDEYLYIRFVSDHDAVTFVILEWDVPECIEGIKPLQANTTFSLYTSTSSVYYRIKYADFAGYDLTVNWEGASRLTFSIGDTCKFVNNPSHARVIHYKAVNKKTAYVIPAATVDSWAHRVNSGGFLYVRFSSVSGKITFQTDKPAIEETSISALSECGCEA